MIKEEGEIIEKTGTSGVIPVCLFDDVLYVRRDSHGGHEYDKECGIAQVRAVRAVPCSPISL